MRLAAMALGLMAGLAATGTGLAQEYSASGVLDFFARELAAGQTRDACGGAITCTANAPAAAFDVLVNFELNAATLTRQASENLLQIATALKDERLQAAKFVVEGHTDASGTTAYNARLAQARAAAVVAFLVAQGIASDRMTALGLGEAAPRVPDPYDPINRRVEIRLSLD